MIAVTGGTGFIGSNLVKRLVDDGHKPIVISRSPYFRNLDGLGINRKKYTFRLANLCNPAETDKAFANFGTVYHLAATVGGQEYLHGSLASELTTMQRNLQIDSNVFQACSRHNVKKIIYASSVSVYPMDKQYKTKAIFKETDKPTTNLDGGYGWAKLIGEKQLEWMWEQWKGGIGIARIFSAYGVNEPLDPMKAHLIGNLCRKIILGENELEIIGGKQTRDYLYISDCVEALVRIADFVNDNKIVVLNVGSSILSSISFIAHKLVQISGKNVGIAFKPMTANNPLSRTADINQARSLLRWQPTIPLDEGLRKTYEWAEKCLS